MHPLYARRLAGRAAGWDMKTLVLPEKNRRALLRDICLPLEASRRCEDDTVLALLDAVRFMPKGRVLDAVIEALTGAGCEGVSGEGSEGKT